MVAIPDKLLEATALFNHWAADQMHQAEQEKKISDPLYHYTDANGLKGIIEKREIWFTSHRYLNDPTELSFGIDAAHEAIATVSEKRSDRVKFFCSMLADLLNVGNMTQTLEYLLASFSYERNDLGQWRAYASDGRGFALGLAPHLFAVEEEKPDQKPNEKIGVYPIEYGRARARERHYEIIKKAADIFEHTVNKHEDLMQDEIALAFTDNYVKHVMAGATIFVSLTSKHEAYQHEREVRLMMLGVRSKFEPYIETRVRNDELVAFVRHPMPLIKEPGSIVEIVTGPCVGVDAEHAVRSLLNSAGIDPSVPIRPSGIPYRAR
jgi:hypothetical protein